MKFSANKLACLALVLIVLPLAGFASIRKFWSRMEYSYSYVSATGRVLGTAEVYDPYSGTYLTNNVAAIDRKIKAGIGLGQGFGIFFPVARLGEKSVLAIFTEYNECAFLWGNLNAVYSANGGYYYGNSDVSGLTAQIGLPVGLDVKFGCDGLATRDYRFCATIGAGAATTLNATLMSSSAYDAGVGFNIGVNPYIKGEVGIRAGICWKLRGVFAFGSVPYVSAKSAIAAGNMEVIGKTHTTLSLVLMPFAFLWRKSSWSDTPTWYKHHSFRRK